MLRTAPSLLAIAVLASGARAQNPLSRDFVKSFFARRETWIDRRFRAASAERRHAAVKLLVRAYKAGTGSYKSQRADLLAKAAALLQGLDPDDAQFRERFNFYLLALPEVVDPSKTVDDARLVHHIGRQIYPLLKPTVDAKAVVANADKIFITARGVYPTPKPDRLAVRLSYRGPPGAADVEPKLVEEAEDPAGWLRTALYAPFSFSNDSGGRYTALGDVRSGTNWARPADPPLDALFWVSPGFHARIRQLLLAKQKILALTGAQRPSLSDLARLDVCTSEVMRVFVLGKDYRLRSWPVEALSEGLELANSLLAGKSVAQPASGDRTYGIALDAGASIPCRVIWNEVEPRQERTAYVFFAPESWDENFAIDGLRLRRRELFGGKPRVIVFLHHPSGAGYIPGVQRMLSSEFGVSAHRTHLVGILDGGVRLDYALQLFKGQVAELVQIGGATPDADLLANGKTDKFRVLPAYGLPTEDGLANFRLRLKNVFGREEYPRVRVDPIGPRSVGEAVLEVLR